MEQLTITLNGKTYTAPNPKVKLWRELTKFQEINEGKDLNKVLDEVLLLVSKTFDHPDVTPEAIEEYMDLEELLPTFYKIIGWVNKVVQSKTSQLPNTQTPAAN